MNDSQIESLLRKAPAPQPPTSLLEQLQNDVRLPQIESDFPEISLWQKLWRLWPALVCLIIGITVVTGQIQIAGKLSRENESLRAAVSNQEHLKSQNAEYQRLIPLPEELKRLEGERAEIQTLKTEIARLRGALTEGEKLEAENARLVAALNLPSGTLSDGRFSKGKRIQCINNLKNIGLAARIWASDNKDILPSDFQTMKNELNTPKILHCPSDEDRPIATNWDNFSEADCSYEILSPGVAAGETEVVYVRCRVHGNFGLANGAVMQSDGSRVLTQKDGKWILEAREN